VGSQPVPAARPDESAVAASIGRGFAAQRPAQGVRADGGPDESTVAASINRTPFGQAEHQLERPDESTVASSISGR
jgi:hypothetical protein